MKALFVRLRIQIPGLAWVSGLFCLAALLAACSRSSAPAPTAFPILPSAAIVRTLPPPGVTTFPLPTRKSSLRPAITITPPISSTPTITSTPTFTSTPNPYAGLSIDELSARSYGGGQLAIREPLDTNGYFTRTLITYPSDGLTIYGFMNTPRQAPPNGQERYPVIIMLHGYIDPNIYNTVDYTTRYADALADAGFLVIHPNLRGYPPSDDGDNRFRVGMAIDVLNLIALVKEQAGKPGPLENADPNAIGLWGHSMGGGVVTRVITISPDVRAAVLYGAMSGDEKKNYQRIFTYFSAGTRGAEELQAPDDVFQRVSPINYLDRIKAAVSIHHGKDDPDVPLAWSLDLCQRLQKLTKPVECFTYPDEPHTFHGEGDALFIQRAIDFFNKQLGSR